MNVASPRSNPLEELSARAADVDSRVRAGFSAHLAPVFPVGLAVLAVGGYGRRELFPHSDVDLLFLVDRAAPDRSSREALSAFIQSLWDSKLRVSHSLRAVPECCEIHERNIELNISLLDQRFLIGDSSLYRRLQEKLPGFLQSARPTLERALASMARARHAKFQNTVYHLEPDVKESPGGLRDVNMIEWFGDAPPAGAKDFLACVRSFLHTDAGRDANQLTFDLQEQLPSHDSPEALMRDYYRYARAVHSALLRRIDVVESAGSGLFAGFREWRSRLTNADFTVARERVLLKAPLQLRTDRDLAMRLFFFVARHGISPARDTEDRLRAAAPLPVPSPAWPVLSEFLRLPNVAPALRAMEDTGYLQVLFPEWKDMECLVVRDFYHRYTVDEHTLVTLRTLEELAASTDPDRRRFRDLLAETEQLHLLRFALLFHDSGKAARTGNHSVESVRIAAEVMNRIGAPEAEAKTVLFLIDRHLELSSVITSRDLEDPDTGAWIATRTETLENLKLLTLLTYADISAVHPEAMTPWRREQLWHAYRAGWREHTRALDEERIAEPTAFEGFPVRYSRTHTGEQMQRHRDLIERFRTLGVAVDLARHGALWTLTVVAPDRPGLFASLAGALAAAAMNIVKAEAFANAREEVLDTFVFADPTRTLELNVEEVDNLRRTVEQVVLGKVSVEKLLARRPRPRRPATSARVHPSVTIERDLSRTATLIEVVAEDRPGLLYDLTNVLARNGCNIEVVLIDTEAHKALDVFYVTAQSAKLPADLEAKVRAELLNVI
ncbi:MAG: ACT domain-containing protein [Bryobacteraceae bacterium]|nr:ACT domain-containing protein [Bryobacteraceae bacterium]